MRIRFDFEFIMSILVIILVISFAAGMVYMICTGDTEKSTQPTITVEPSTPTIVVEPSTPTITVEPSETTVTVIPGEKENLYWKEIIDDLNDKKYGTIYYDVLISTGSGTNTATITQSITFSKLISNTQNELESITYYDEGMKIIYLKSYYKDNTFDYKTRCTLYLSYSQIISVSYGVKIA